MLVIIGFCLCYGIQQQESEAGEPSYNSANVPPSKFPERHFCSVCGYPFITSFSLTLSKFTSKVLAHLPVFGFPCNACPSIKAWLNEVASRCKFRTCFCLGLHLARTCMYCVVLCSLYSWVLIKSARNSVQAFHPTIWPPNVSQCKLITQHLLHFDQASLSL